MKTHINTANANGKNNLRITTHIEYNSNEWEIRDTTITQTKEYLLNLEKEKKQTRISLQMKTVIIEKS